MPLLVIKRAGRIWKRKRYGIKKKIVWLISNRKDISWLNRTFAVNVDILVIYLSIALKIHGKKIAFNVFQICMRLRTVIKYCVIVVERLVIRRMTVLKGTLRNTVYSINMVILLKHYVSFVIKRDILIVELII